VAEAARINPIAWTNFERDVTANRPRYIIDADSSDGALYPIDRYPVLKKYLAGYRCVWHAPDGDVYESSSTREWWQ
jgi:hypothetical protein